MPAIKIKTYFVRGMAENDKVNFCKLCQTMVTSHANWEPIKYHVDLRVKDTIRNQSRISKASNLMNHHNQVINNAKKVNFK
jgi:hypothetical protein